MASIDLRTALAACFPGLPAQDRASLHKSMYSELEARVGSRLAKRLTTEELTEFDDLADDESRTKWLEENAADYPRVIAQVSAETLAQALIKIGQADPAALVGDNSVAEVAVVGLDLVAGHFRERQFSFEEVTDGLIMMMSVKDGYPAVSFRLRVTEGNPAFVSVVGYCPTQRPESERPTEERLVDDFVKEWNEKSMLSIACTSGSDDQPELAASVGLLLPYRLEPASFDEIMRTAMMQLVRVFDVFWDRVDAADSGV